MQMSKLIINSYEEFAAHLGQKLGESDWLTVDQDRINKFADATLAHIGYYPIAIGKTFLAGNFGNLGVIICIIKLCCTAVNI